jgi:hypothetical protein
LKLVSGNKTPWLALGGLALIALLVRVPLLPLHAYRWGGGTDSSEYKGWMQVIHEHGILNIFRATQTDYVGYHWILWLLTLVYAPFGDSYSDTADGLHLLIKIPPLLFEAGLIAAVYIVTRSLVAEAERGERAPWLAPATAAMVMAAVIALHPASLYDAAVWGQIDAATALGMLLAVFFVVRKQHLLAGAIWGVAFVIKPQPVVVAPLLAVLAFDRGDWRSLLKLAAGGLVAGFVMALPWVAHGDLRRIGGIYESLVKEDLGRLSGASWNFWWFRDLSGDYGPNDRIASGLPLTYRTAGTLLTGVFVLVALAFAWAKPSLERALIAAAYMVFAFWMFSTSSHDRYLYPLLALLLPVIASERRWLWLYVPLSITFTINIVVSAPPSEGWAHGVLESPFSLAIASVNLVLFGVYTAVLVRGLHPLREFSLTRSPAQPAPA